MATLLDLLTNTRSAAQKALSQGVATINTLLKQGAAQKKAASAPVSTAPVDVSYGLGGVNYGKTPPVSAPVEAVLRAPTQKESNKISMEAFKANPTVAGGFNLLNSLNTQLGSAIQQKVVNPAPTTQQQVQRNLNLGTLPARIASELFPGAARATEAVTRPVLSSGEKALNYVNASDEYKTKNTLEGLAALGSTAYEAAMLYGGLAKGAGGTLASLASPRIVSGLAAAAPQDVQEFIRPGLEAYSVVKSPDKVLAGLNVAAGRATDPLSNLVNRSNLSQPVKDIANLGINVGENLLAYKGAKAFAPSQAGIQAGYKAYQGGAKPLDVVDTALKARDDYVAANKPKVESTGPAVGEVLGFSSPMLKGVDPKKVKKVVPQEFRADKLSLDDDGVARMKVLQDELKLSTRQVRSFEEMADMAKKFDADTDALLSSSKRITDAEVVALKNLIAQDSDFIAKNQGDPGEATQLKVEQANARIQKAIKRLIPAGTEAGRAVVAFKLLANKNMDPAAWLLRGQRVKGDKGLTAQEQATITRLAQENDRTGLALYVANLRQPTVAEKFGTLWKAGLLTSPTTHIANVTSNTAMGLLKVPEKLIATGLDKAASLVTGKRTTTFSPGAMLKGYGQGAVNAYDYLKTGIDPDALGKVDVKANPIKNPLLKGYTDTVFRSLGAEDIVFKGGPYAESIASQAKVIGMNEGLRGKGLTERVKELIAVPTDEMLLQAKKDAQEATFQQDNVLASTASGIKNKYVSSDNPLKQMVGAAADMVVPFTKTPTNVALETLKRTPAGIIGALAKQLSPKTRSQKDLVESLSKGITGTGLVGLGALLFREGMATGQPPDDQSERERWYAEGKQANAIKIGDHWFQLNRISPLGNLISLGAEYERLGKEQAGLQLAGSTALTGAGGLLDQTFLSGVSDLLDAIKDPDRYGERWSGNFVASVVPSIVSRIARGLDPVLRKPDSISDYLAARTPGLTGSVAPVIDLFGNEVTREGGLGKSLFDPFNSSKVNNDPTLKEIQKVGADIGVPSNRMYNTTLDNREFAEFQKLQGGVLKDVLDSIIKGQEYQSLKDYEKTQMLEEAAKTVKDEVKAAVFPAIMITRYKLPEDTNPEVLTEIINETSALPEFKKMSLEDQRGVILDVLSSVR